MTEQRRFSNEPERFRFAMRYAIQWLGGEIQDYAGTGFTVAFPSNGNVGAIYKLIEGAGYMVGNEHYFPLVTDKPPAHLRHRCPRYQRPDDEPGYWYRGTAWPVV